jgi:hypothetical protein
MWVMRRARLLLFFSLIVAACTSPPEAVETKTEEPVPVGRPVEPVSPLPVVRRDPVPVPEVKLQEEMFNPASVSQEVFDTAKSDIQHLIGTLNRIIREKNFKAWVSYLSKEYFEEISSAAFLADVSSQARWRNQAKLTGAEDYFLRVVVPSRASDRVDDIEFVTQRRIKAYTINARGQRLRLYDLEHTEDGWRIIN